LLNQDINIYIRGGKLADMKQTLQFTIMTIFIVLFAALSGSVAWYTFEKNSRAALALSDDIIRCPAPL